MKSETSPAPGELQRLVDGELSTTEVREMLLSAEQNPHHWRAIACEFVEEQLFRRQFENLVAASEATQPAPVPAANTKSSAKCSAEHSLKHREPITKTKRGPSFAIRRLAVAAGIAVAGWFGFLIGSENPPPGRGDTRSNLVGRNMIADASPTPSTLTPVNLEPEYQLELLTPDGEAINGEVDLYRYQDLNRLYANRPDQRRLSLDDVLPPSGISGEMRQRLSRSGYGVNESTNYVSGRLEDGRQFVVPVRSIRFDRGH